MRVEKRERERLGQPQAADCLEFKKGKSPNSYRDLDKRILTRRTRT